MSNETDLHGARTFKNIGRLTCVFIILSAVMYSATHSQGLKVALGGFLYWIQGLGFWGLAAMFVAYVIAVVLVLPTTLLNLGAGYCFGVLLAFPCIWAGALCGATISFWLGRTLARDCVKSYFYGYSSHMKKVDQVLLQGRNAFRFVFLSRVPPCMPFPILNYLYGTTGVNFKTYVSGTGLGLVPGTFIYVYVGHALHSLVDLLSGDPKTITLEYQVIFVVGVAMTVVVSIYLANEARLVGQLPLPTEERQYVQVPDCSEQVSFEINDMHRMDLEPSPSEHVALLCDEASPKPHKPGFVHSDEESFMHWLSKFNLANYRTTVVGWWQHLRRDW